MLVEATREMPRILERLASARSSVNAKIRELLQLMQARLVVKEAMPS
ncbi:hypothetical protein [Burkholderia sp. BCC0405]|nr:hypothetical protein [Burkholderia sp. BCC0405]